MATSYSQGMSDNATTTLAYVDWDDYPDSPLPTIDYPSQVIIRTSGGDTNLYLSTGTFYYVAAEGDLRDTTGSFKWYQLQVGAWVLMMAAVSEVYFSSSPTFKAAYNDVYTSAALVTVYYPAQGYWEP